MLDFIRSSVEVMYYIPQREWGTVVIISLVKKMLPDHTNYGEYAFSNGSQEADVVDVFFSTASGLKDKLPRSKKR